MICTGGVSAVRISDRPKVEPVCSTLLGHFSPPRRTSHGGVISLSVLRGRAAKAVKAPRGWENQGLSSCSLCLWMPPPTKKEPTPSPKESKLAEVLSALRLKQMRERRNLMQALGEREQYHSQRLSRIEKHQETQLGTMNSQLTSLSRQLQWTSSKQRQPPCPHPQPWRGRSG